MSQEIKVAKTLDASNLYCPMPIVKLSSAIKGIAIGDVIEVIATDPGVIADMPNWAVSTGNEILKQTIEGDIIKFWIKRRI